MNPKFSAVIFQCFSKEQVKEINKEIKKNIIDNNVGLEAINKIRVRNFEYRNKDEIATEATEWTDSQLDAAVVDKAGPQLGVIAQEIEGILPDLIVENDFGLKTLDADNMTWYLVNAVKELSARVKELESK